MIPSGAVYIVSGITNMRKSIDGQSLIVADVLEMDPLSSACSYFAIVAEIKSNPSLGYQRILALLSSTRKRLL
ncbi:hypothetical protein ASV53_20030 [Photobacterium sanguinicancri]|uniref:Uncharacterized protein n=1 Tax=Photobacterium sanguinicancri TaxID=875932 RepID=A0ABX4FTF1_9GAMM|nr:hypothetical protein ASV53_20030 [Photobacterium sanguinicancri]